MAVDAEVSRAIIKEELALVRELAACNRWGIIPRYGELKVLATMYSHKADLYLIEITCSNYKEYPPFFEFIDPDTGEYGTKHAYPRSHDSLFHDSGPCICAPFNQKAYKSVVATGPHDNWHMANWMNSRENNTDWSNYSKLGDMLGLIYTRISRPDYYKGRMA